MIKRLLILLLLSAMLTNGVICQREYSIKEILSVIDKRFAHFANVQSLQNFISNGNIGAPIIEKIEFRTETDEFDLSRQEFLLRTSFNNPKEKKIIHSNYTDLVQLEKMEQILNSIDHVYDAYKLIAEWRYLQKEIQIKKQLYDLTYQKLKIEKLEVQNGEQDKIRSYVRLKEELEEQRLKLDQLKIETLQIIYILLGPDEASTNSTIMDEGWITVNQIQQLLIHNNEPELAGNMDLTIKKQKIKLAENNYHLEEVEGNRILDYLQVKYAGREGLITQKEFSIGIGINLPTGHINRVNKSEAQFDILLEKQKFQETKFLLNEEIRLQRIEIEAMIQKLHILESTHLTDELKELVSRLKKSGFYDPESTLIIREMEMKAMLNKLELEKEIVLSYLKYLMLIGEISNETTVAIFQPDLK